VPVSKRIGARGIRASLPHAVVRILAVGLGASYQPG